MIQSHPPRPASACDFTLIRVQPTLCYVVEDAAVYKRCCVVKATLGHRDPVWEKKQVFYANDPNANQLRKLVIVRYDRHSFSGKNQFRFYVNAHSNRSNIKSKKTSRLRFLFSQSSIVRRSVTQSSRFQFQCASDVTMDEKTCHAAWDVKLTWSKNWGELARSDVWIILDSQFSWEHSGSVSNPIDSIFSANMVSELSMIK